jgi:hypothetical protein
VRTPRVRGRGGPDHQQAGDPRHTSRGVAARRLGDGGERLRRLRPALRGQGLQRPVQRAARVRVGDPSDPSTEVGALVHRDLRTPFGGVKASGLGREGPALDRLLHAVENRARRARRHACPPVRSVAAGLIHMICAGGEEIVRRRREDADERRSMARRHYWCGA